MQVVSLSYPLPIDLYSSGQQQKVLAIGEFDGIHLGHQEVISRAVKTARSFGVPAAVMTFNPHPRQVLGNDQYALCLTPLEEKIQLFEQMGIDIMYVMSFDHHFMQLSPNQFVDDILLPLQVETVVIGFDFTFGFKGKGNPDTLSDLAKGLFVVEVVRPYHLDDAKVSSTLIRECLEQGDVQKAGELLGRAYRISGIIVHGEGRGRTLGFPTANIEVQAPYVVPQSGVYAVQLVRGGETFEGVMNIGTKPTFHQNEQKISLEVFLLNFSGDLYEEEVKIDFFAFLRKEQKFPSIDLLLAQIEQDVQQAQEIFTAANFLDIFSLQAKRDFTL